MRLVRALCSALMDAIEVFVIVAGSIVLAVLMVGIALHLSEGQ